jgi:hypothetical protein
VCIEILRETEKKREPLNKQKPKKRQVSSFVLGIRCKSKPLKALEREHMLIGPRNSVEEWSERRRLFCLPLFFVLLTLERSQRTHKKAFY